MLEPCLPLSIVKSLSWSMVMRYIKKSSIICPSHLRRVQLLRNRLWATAKLNPRMLILQSRSSHSQAQSIAKLNPRLHSCSAHIVVTVVCSGLHARNPQWRSSESSSLLVAGKAREGDVPSFYKFGLWKFGYLQFDPNNS